MKGRGRRAAVLFFVLSGFWAFSGCGSGPETDAPDTAIRVNDVTISTQEFNDLIKLQSEFDELDAVVATIECHDRYRCRLMVGRETDALYWFSKNSFQKRYQDGIWWPHLSDLAGRVGATYGVGPMAFAVHAEYVNRPSTIIIDPEGIVRFAYIGTYWGDRPTMHQTLEMIRNKKFDFEHPNRR